MLRVIIDKFLCCFKPDKILIEKSNIKEIHLDNLKDNV